MRQRRWRRRSRCDAPVLAISGQIFEQHIGKGIGFLHEVPDQLGIMKTLTKWAAHIDGPEDAGGKIREAFRQLLSGVPQPVGIECGWNMWRRERRRGVRRRAGAAR